MIARGISDVETAYATVHSVIWENSSRGLRNLRSRRLRLRKRTRLPLGGLTHRSTMPTTPDVKVNPRFPAAAPAPAPTPPGPRPDIEDEQTSLAGQILVGVFVGVPMLALAAAIPLMWGWGLGWHDVIIALVFYWVSGLGITVGYHRYFTHSSFKATRQLRVAMAIAGSMAMEGPVITWVSDHRRHHKYSDKEGDPHSPWRFGN